jgi:Transcriptional regulator
MSSALSLAAMVTAANDEGDEAVAREPAERFLEQNAMRLFYRWGNQLASTLVRVRARFDGDLDQCLLYLVFLLAEISETLPRGPRPPPTFRRHRGLNALSLSDITQIPRETTRRKLLALVERGYLVRQPDGLYALGEACDAEEFFADLKPLFWDASAWSTKIANPKA